MNPTTLLNLAACVEAATAPERELDAEIIRATEDVNPFLSIRDWTYLKGGKSYRLPAYTASLDAAMSLANDDPLPIIYEALALCPGVGEDFTKALPRFLTAAALRARAASEAGDAQS